jgi:hypothetical protein
MPFTAVKEETMVSTVAEHFGFTPEHVVAAAKEAMGRGV